MTHPTTASAARAALLAASLAAASLLLPTAAPAFDTEANVNDTRDLPDPSPNVGGCESTAGTCTLRAAIMRANKRTGQHVIRVAAGTYALTRAGREEDDAETGDLDVRRDTTITGAGAGVTIIDAAGIDRVFDLSGRRNITLKDLTIRGGDAESVDLDGREGGGIRIGRINDGNGNVKLVRVVVENNFSNGSGGGVFMTGTRSLRIERSALVDNTAFGVGSFGAGIEIQGGTLTITDTTISRNASPDGGASGLPVIDLFGGTPATIRRSTIVGEPGQTLIANRAFGVATADLAATILQGSGASCADREPIDNGNSLVVFDSGNNVESGDTCGFLAFKGNLVNTSAQLGPLLRAGGTVFHNLGATSPAIDHVPAAQCGATVDQRGLPRPRAGTRTGVANCDVGAIEVQGVRGEPAVTAAQSTVRRAGDPLDLTYSWRVPDGGTWHDLATLDLRLVDDGRIVFWLRWFEDGDRFVELSATGEPIGAGGASFKPGFVLDDERAASQADGPESPEVTLHLSLLAARARSGGLTAEVSATDDDGGTQSFSSVALLGDGGGALLVPRLDGRLPVPR